MEFLILIQLKYAITSLRKVLSLLISRHDVIQEYISDNHIKRSFLTEFSDQPQASLFFFLKGKNSISPSC